MKVHIGVNARTIYGNDTSVFWAFRLAMIQKSIEGVTAVTYTASQKRPIYAGRNDIVRNFMEEKSDVLVLLDTDTIPPSDILVKLLPHLKEYGVASGLYMENTGTYLPVAYSEQQDHPDGFPIWQRLQKWEGELIEVAGVGLGCCAIKKEVFEKLKHPYFDWEFDETKGYKRPREKGHLSIGEDLYFCRKVKDAGFKIAVDTSCLCDHIGVNVPISSPKTRSKS